MKLPLPLLQNRGIDSKALKKRTWAHALLTFVVCLYIHPVKSAAPPSIFQLMLMLMVILRLVMVLYSPHHFYRAHVIKKQLI